jgi:non-specific serine/threonine protein kinase/serine/threonine-protein kinase
MSDDVTQASASHRSVETIGPYRLLQRVGEGGMGEVWLAEQTRPVHRQVALKIIKAGMDTAHVVARFEAERQALAVMDHPAIARVFDGGATPHGRPYFVMEYVRGEAITSYCNRHKLSTRQRIDLFLQVCDGVQHAHQKGIIHRDLKPSNILITLQDDHPVPKIIDFGVAKATTQHLTERTLYTELGVLIGTPEYMSPEQAEMTGLDIDTRTDVYSLGVILYELLTGTLPFEGKSLREKPLDEIRRTIREVDPPRPSTRVTTLAAAAETSGDQGVAAAKASELNGDLDWITMRALEKDRTRRYGSAADLAADLRRHVDNLPVLASPPSATYRIRKFVQRHRVGVAAAATMVALLIAFAAAMAVQARRIARERDRANQEADAARQVSDFLVGLFNVSDPSEARGNSITAREMLDKGAKDIQQRLAAQPQIQARLQTTIGTVYTDLGLYTEAEPLLKGAVAIQRRIDANRPETLSAVNALANLYWYLGRFAEAEPLYLDIVDRRRRIGGLTHRDTLHAEYDLASVYVAEKRWDVGEPLLRHTLELQRQTLGELDPDTVASMNNLASLYWNQSRYADAEPLYTRVLAARRRRFGTDHPDTLGTLHNLGTLYVRLGRLSEAEPLLAEAAAMRRRVLGENHPSAGSSRSELALLYQRQGRYADAEREFLAAALILHVSPQRPSSLHAVTVQGSRFDIAARIAALYEEWGKPDKAAEWRAKLPEEPAAKTAAR